MYGCHHSSKDPYGTVTVSFPGSTASSPAARNSSTRCPSLVPARPDSSSAPGSRSRTADQNVLSGPLPSAKSQTHAATTPPGRVTRAISASPATGSAMKCTTSWASAASTLRSASGSRSAAACCTTTPGHRRRAAATNDADGSTATTRAAPSRSTSRTVSAPGPQPTSSARRPGPTPAHCTNRSASGSEYRPMNAEYASAPTSNATPKL